MPGSEAIDPRLAALHAWVAERLAGFTLEPASADASFRRYFRVRHAGGTLIAMDAPPPQAQARDAKKFPAEVEWVEGWIHEINMARSLFGEAKQVIFATNEMPRLALVEFEKARGLFEVGLMNPPGSVFDCTIALHCDQGRIDLDFAPPLAFRQRSQIKITTPASVSYPSLTYQESFVQELVHFLQCIRGLAAPHTTVQDAQRDLELAFEIIRHL